MRRPVHDGASNRLKILGSLWAGGVDQHRWALHEARAGADAAVVPVSSGTRCNRVWEKMTGDGLDPRPAACPEGMAVLRCATAGGFGSRTDVVRGARAPRRPAGGV